MLDEEGCVASEDREPTTSEDSRAERPFFEAYVVTLFHNVVNLFHYIVRLNQISSS